MGENARPIIVEQTFKAPRTAVWKAITDKDQMRQWFFEPMQDFQPEVGFETEFDVEFEGITYRHQWRVTDLDEENRIQYDWKYAGIPGESSVTWELAETTDGTKLTLTHAGGETFPQDNPVFSREAGIAGWTYLVQQSLKGFLGEG